jgi:hypothetical protein
MEAREFEDAIKNLHEDHGRVMKLIKRTLPLTEEQKQQIAEILARQKREYDEFLEYRAGKKGSGDLIQDARNAARRAALGTEAERKEEREQSPGNWRAMWIAIAIAGVVLLFLRLQFH